MSILSVYITDKGLSQLTQKDIYLLDILNIGFGIIKNGEISLENLPHLKYMKAYKLINPRLKIYLSIASGVDYKFSQATATFKDRQRLINSIVEVIEKWDFDGIDVDWEYPTGVTERHNHTLLLKELRERLDNIKYSKRKGLSVAAGSKSWYFEITELANSVCYLDYVNLMSYDMNANEIVTMHHTCPTKMDTDLVQEGSTEENIELFIKNGVPPEKLIIGAAFYSRQWKGVENKHNGLYSYAGTTSDYGPGYTQLIKDYINKNGYIRYWDEVAHAPYLFNGDNFITYEDEDSLKYKCYLVKKWNIAGIMAWEYSYDEEHTLINLMYDALQ